MVPALVDSIKAHGLALVTDRSEDGDGDGTARAQKGVDGVLKSHGILRFNDSIDV